MLVRLYFLLILLFSAFLVNGQALLHQWGYGIGGVTFSDNAFEIEATSTNDIIISGTFSDTVDFDPSINDSLLTTSFIYSRYVARYSGDGALMWVRQIEAYMIGPKMPIYLDSLDNIYVAGTFRDSINFTPGIPGNKIILDNKYHMFFAKYDSDFNFLWGKVLIANAFNQSLTDIIVDDSLNIYLSGYVKDSLDVDPSGNTVYLFPTGVQDAFIAKYDNLGNYLWSIKTEGDNQVFPNNISVDKNSNIYMTGNFNGTVDFDPVLNNGIHSSVGSVDIFLAKYSNTGQYMWSFQKGGSNSDASEVVAVDDSLNVYIGGRVNSNNAFITKYNEAGNMLWEKNVTIGNIYDIYVNKNQEVCLTGQYNGNNTHLTINGPMTVYGNGDPFIAKYLYDGSLVWIYSGNANAYSYGTHIVEDNANNIYYTGSYQDSISLSIPAVGNMIHSNGNQDFFLSKYHECSPQITNVDTTICFEDSIFLQGTFRNVTGQYFDTLITIQGCDSVIQTTLQVLTPFVDTVVISICSGDSVSLLNDYYFSTTVIYDTLQTVQGCDSVIQYNITFHDENYIYQNITICETDSVYLNNEFQNISGIYIDSLVSMYGCDSIISTALNVIPIYYGVAEYREICTGDSSSVGGSYVNTSGVYYDVFTTINGCDSLIPINIVVHEQPTVFMLPFSVDTICTNDSIYSLPTAIPSGGIYSGDGVIEPYLVPSLAQLGRVWVVYTYADNNSCVGFDSSSIFIVECFTGINEYEGKFKVFPNPFTDYITITDDNGGNYYVSIISSLGKEVVHKVKKTTKTTKIITDYLPSGVYFLKIENENKTLLYSGKIIKYTP